MYWRVALLVLLTTSVPQAKAEPPDEEALRLLNHYRHLAGLTSVKLDRQTQRGVHGARKLHGAEPRHRRNGRAQSPYPAAELARRERRGCGMCWLFPATKLRPPYQSLRFWK